MHFWVLVPDSLSSCRGFITHTPNLTTPWPSPPSPTPPTTPSDSLPTTPPTTPHYATPWLSPPTFRLTPNLTQTPNHTTPWPSHPPSDSLPTSSTPVPHHTLTLTPTFSRGFIRRWLPAIYRHLFCLEPLPILAVTSSYCGLENWKISTDFGSWWCNILPSSQYPRRSCLFFHFKILFPTGLEW